MSAQTLRKAALRRSHVKDYVLFMLEEDAASYDIENLITELADEDDQDYRSMNPALFWNIAALHEFDDRGLTVAALSKALRDSQIGWTAMIRQPDGDVQSINIYPDALGNTPEEIEAGLRRIVRFPEGTSMMILPLVG